PSTANCLGTPLTFDYTINATPDITGVYAPQTLCAGQATNAVTFSGNYTGTVYSWVNSSPAIGLPASGFGDIAPFITTNNTLTPIVATITVTPTRNGCDGTPISFTITVNPNINPDVTMVNNALNPLCSGVPVKFTA